MRGLPVGRVQANWKLVLRKAPAAVGLANMSGGGSAEAWNEPAVPADPPPSPAAAAANRSAAVCATTVVPPSPSLEATKTALV